MYQYRQILVRLRQGDSDRDIARSGLMGRKKVAAVRELAGERGWLDGACALPEDAELAAALAPDKRAASCVSSVAAYREQIGAWTQAGVPGTTIHAALVRNHGYAGSYSAVRRMIQAIDGARPVEATSILDFAPGEAAQVDFGAGPRITDCRTGQSFKTWFFVMTLCFSRHQYVEVVRDQSSLTWLACHRRAFEWFGGVVARVIIDNPKCAITRACIHDPEVQRAYGELAEGYGFRIDPCPPRDPQKKGIVEAGVKYVKRSFLPLRSFRDLAEANAQATAWVMEIAGGRVHGTTRVAPLRRFAEVERALLRPLPERAPQLAAWAKVTVHRDAHVQFEKCLYSAPFALVRQVLWLKATDTVVQLFQEHALVATHPRLREPGRRSTVSDHLPPDALAWKLRDTQWCLREAEQVGPGCAALVAQLFGDRVLEHLRAVQGILRQKETYGATRLEAACRRALSFGSPRYRTVKEILKKGLDLQESLVAFDTLADTYTRGGRFCRFADELLCH